MGGPIPDFAPGEPAFPALNADVLNRMKAGIFDGVNKKPRHHVPEITSNSTIECFVRNSSSATFPIHSILAINSTASASLTVTSDQEKIRFQDNPVFNVNVPVASTDFPFVLLEPLRPSGGIARAAIGGIAVCTVNVTDAGHEYANPTAGDHTKMTSGATGQVRILHKPSGTGNLTCAVYLVESAGGSSIEYGEGYPGGPTNIFGVQGTLIQVNANSTLNALFNLVIDFGVADMIEPGFEYINRSVGIAWNVPPYTPLQDSAPYPIKWRGSPAFAMQFCVPFLLNLTNNTGSPRSAIFVLTPDSYSQYPEPPHWPPPPINPPVAGIAGWTAQVY